MVEGRTDEFLRLEEQAHGLLDELERLRRETESYAVASESLDGASNRLKKTVDSLDKLIEAVKELSESMRSAGLPALIDRHDSHERQLVTLSERTGTLEQVGKDLETQARNQYEALTKDMRKLGNVGLIALILIVLLVGIVGWQALAS